MTKPCQVCGGTDRNASGRCRACARRKARRWRKKHPYATRTPSSEPCAKCGHAERYKNGDCKECAKARARGWYNGNLKKARASSKVRRLAKYGVTPARVAEMLREQGSCCAICRRPFESTLKTHIDHSHTRGEPRELLCAACNLGLGHVERDGGRWLSLALAYLRKHGDIIDEDAA